MKRFSQEFQRSIVEDLQRLVAERAQSEASLEATNTTRHQAVGAQAERERAELEAKFAAEKEELSRSHNARLAEVVQEYESALAAAKRQHDQQALSLARQTEAALQGPRNEHELACVRIEHEHDAEVQSAAQDLHDAKAEVKEGTEQLEAARADLEKVLRRRRCRRAARDLAALEPVVSNQPMAFFAAEMDAAAEAMEEFPRQRAARFLGSGGLFVTFIFVWIVGVLVGASVTQVEWPWVVASGAIAVGVNAVLYVVVRPMVVRQTLALCQRIRQHHVNGDKALEGARAIAMANADQRRLAKRKERDAQLNDGQRLLQELIAERQAQRDQQLQSLANEYSATKDSLSQQKQKQQAATNQEFETRHAQLQERFDQDIENLESDHGRQVRTAGEAFDRSRERIVDRWQEGMSKFNDSVADCVAYSQAHFPEWGSVDWDEWTPPLQEVPAVRFGAYAVGLNGFAGETESGDRVIPAITSFGSRPVLLWEAWGDGREAASRSIRNVMLRLFTSLPPGKTRFTIIDPVGLGQNFSAFMHLTDFDEKLVSHRIWTEPSHITQRLTDITQHMEDIIQTYLRNEYETIDEYNREAGEVAEPFQVLVVANFPQGFSEESAARLLSIVRSGKQCGVYTLLSTDSKLDLPRGIELTDLEAEAITLQWDGQSFRWFDPVLKDLALQLDEPPGEEQFTDIVCTHGRRAQLANRVEVPFRTVSPSAGEWWQEDGRGELVVPLGRAGATKLQKLSLGKGTSQHVLISGKTGSGKSTLLHALIMNTAMHYAPSEVEFYLIDFKKGVEFKPYAEYRLPHARVIAIESEREFGMSVLERLDVELRRRGDLFRQRGVQDIRSFRDAHPEEHMPRVLLVVDEFQELFVQDDKLAQDASLVLDRLVRQGRAFGIHVLLGSQTLAGAYSLARSTIGQMAVRIALQCSEADSHLILSEDNNAARLLSRPGEAIYNDANGLFEGNHPFQVVWLSAEDQEDYLKQLATLSEERSIDSPRAIVFEGNVPADIRENVSLESMLTTEPAADAPARIWLGSAVAIKEPSEVVLRRQGGANLVIAGQQEAAALGLLANAVVALTAGGRDDPDLAPRFVVLRGTTAEASQDDIWDQLAAKLPSSIEVLAPNQVAAAVNQLHAELQGRLSEPNEASSPVFVIAFHLSRFRDLRRADDDFGFGGLSGEQELSAAQQFAELLREGPACGIHQLIWCDSYSNLGRWFDRQTLREFDHRVLFQMSATDSSNLMDSPAASRLGENRALVYSEEQGAHEKFRPYAVPDAQWLSEVAARLESRAQK